VLQSCIGTVAGFTASRSPLIVQPRLRDQADYRTVERGRQGDRDDPAGRDRMREKISDGKLQQRAVTETGREMFRGIPLKVRGWATTPYLVVARFVATPVALQQRTRFAASPDSAAFSVTWGEAPMTSAMNAADMAEATPISDWQPPSAPESVALCLHR